VGLDKSDDMLSAARQTYEGIPLEQRQWVTLKQGDMRSWTDEEPFDLILIIDGSASHLLNLDDQVCTWR